MWVLCFYCNSTQLIHSEFVVDFTVAMIEFCDWRKYGLTRHIRLSQSVSPTLRGSPQREPLGDMWSEIEWWMQQSRWSYQARSTDYVFTTLSGLYEFDWESFSLCNAPVFFLILTPLDVYEFDLPVCIMPLQCPLPPHWVSMSLSGYLSACVRLLTQWCLGRWWDSLLIYLDNIVVYSLDFDRHWVHR